MVSGPMHAKGKAIELGERVALVFLAEICLLIESGSLGGNPSSSQRPIFWLTRFRLIKFFSLRIIYLLDVYNKIQVGVELLPLGNSRNSRWRPT